MNQKSLVSNLLLYPFGPFTKLINLAFLIYLYTDDVHTAIKNTIKEKHLNDDDYRLILDSNGSISYMSYEDVIKVQNNPGYIEVDVWKSEA